jgi:hypothetical protein
MIFHCALGARRFVVRLEDSARKRSCLKFGGVPPVAIVVTLTVVAVSSLLIHAHILALLMTIMSGHDEALVFRSVTVWAFIATPLRECSSSDEADRTDDIFVMVLVRTTSVLVLCAIDITAIVVPSRIA